jgi:hypothetical protein
MLSLDNPLGPGGFMEELPQPGSLVVAHPVQPGVELRPAQVERGQAGEEGS